MRAIPCLALALALAACSGVDETGYFIVDEIDQSGPAELAGGEDREVLVIGRPGALSAGGGSLVADNPRTGAQASGVVDDAAGSFAAAIPARLGDTLVLRYELAGDSEELELAVTDDLAGVAALDCLLCAGALVGPPEDGESAVALELLDDPTPPFVISNLDRGLVRVAEQIDPSPRIPAAVGDTVCVYRQSADRARASVAVCEDVPSPP
jgi:hypothetical protein